MFRDREEAGQKLAQRLLDDPLIKSVDRNELLVLSIPRGGVVNGAVIAQISSCPHDIVVVKKNRLSRSQRIRHRCCG